MSHHIKHHSSCSLAALCLFNTAPLSLCPTLQETLPTCTPSPCIEELRVAALKAWMKRAEKTVEAEDKDFQGLLGCIYGGIPWPLAAAAAAQLLHGGGVIVATGTVGGTSQGGLAGAGGYMSLASEKVFSHIYQFVLHSVASFATFVHRRMFLFMSNRRTHSCGKGTYPTRVNADTLQLHAAHASCMHARATCGGKQHA